ncbi:hypothetical protein FA13DRAFT_1314668 [Coprinellus micaceus]|uniref:Uncharacterized protein n=1 Tax=Coprinellus micaceus TaxID=71717 RepID=A0A4Y7R4T9_COPMI|nr:hypothetical protein FA13DRAFT_1314668 [Coprinellus micaceus]
MDTPPLLPCTTAMDTSFLHSPLRFPPSTPPSYPNPSQKSSRNLELHLPMLKSAVSPPSATAINLKEKDAVALASGKSVENSDFLRTPASSPEELKAASRVAHRQHFNLEETIPVAFGLIKSKVMIRGTLTWTQPEALALESGGPLYAVYESEVIGGFAIRIYRLRKMEATEEGDSSATKVTEFLYGVGPSYLNFLIAKEAATKHRAHMQRLPELFQ